MYLRSTTIFPLRFSKLVDIVERLLLEPLALLLLIEVLLLPLMPLFPLDILLLLLTLLLLSAVLLLPVVLFALDAVVTLLDSNFPVFNLFPAVVLVLCETYIVIL